MESYKFTLENKNSTFSFTTCSSNENEWKTYLKKELSKEDANFIIRKIEKLNIKILMVGDLFIDKAERGNGHGKKLINKIYEYDFDIALMVCDSFGENTFDLESWYKRLGFTTIIDSANPFMILDNTGIDIF